MKIVKRTIALLLCFCLIFLCCACGGKNETPEDNSEPSTENAENVNKPDKAGDGKIVLPYNEEDGLNPYFAKSDENLYLCDLMYEPLYQLDKTFSPTGVIAESIHVVDNVATVLMIAPIALAVCKKQNISPVSAIIAIAISSNLQGAATLVGDTTAIMLGSSLDMSFVDFFVYQGKPSIFFAVELGAVLSALILAWIFRREKGKIGKGQPKTPVTDYVPTYLLLGTIVLLIAASVSTLSSITITASSTITIL